MADGAEGSKRRGGLVAGILLAAGAGLAAPALAGEQVLVSSAQGGVIFYTDIAGRAASLSGPGLRGQRPIPGGENPDQVATAFRAACLESKLDLRAVDRAVVAPPLGLARDDSKLPFTGPVYAAPVPHWSGRSAALLIAPATVGPPRGGGFRIEGPQCTLAFGEPDFTHEALEAALTRVIGAAPYNAAEAMRKGKPNRSYSPRWLWTMPDGTSQDIGMVLMRRVGDYEGIVQVSLIPPKPARPK